MGENNMLQLILLLSHGLSFTNVKLIQSKTEMTLVISKSV